MHSGFLPTGIPSGRAGRLKTKKEHQKPMKPKKTDFQHVEELSRELSRDKITRERFSLEIPHKDACNAIYAAWKAVVEKRGGTFDLSDQTREQIRQTAEWLTDPHGKPSLLLCGLCGNGKTSLALGLKWLIEYVIEKELGFTNRKEVDYSTAKGIAETRSMSSSTDPSLIRFSNAEMLIVDDLGEEPKEVMVFGMIHTPIIDLMTARYSSQRLTIFTSNLNTDEIKAKYGERVYDRLRESCDIVLFTNDSYRGRKQKQ